MINLRKLLKKDAEYMLEWMLDENLHEYFRFNSDNANKEKVIQFIEHSYSDTNIHLAIVNDHDEYLGTVSLKNIDQLNKNAEFAISLREKAKGTGAARIATEQILDFAFHELLLNKVYLNVYSTNTRAIKFYEKMNFHREGTFVNHICVDEHMKTLEWFAIFKEDL